jgi:Na+/H+-dicarboxylate symporter
MKRLLAAIVLSLALGVACMASHERGTYMHVRVYLKTGEKIIDEVARGTVNYTADGVAFRNRDGLSRQAFGQIAVVIEERDVQ